MTNLACSLVGHETTAAVLAYTTWALGRNIAAQDRLRREIESLGREPTYDDFLGDKLPYLDAVTKEAYVIICLAS